MSNITSWISFCKTPSTNLIKRKRIAHFYHFTRHSSCRVLFLYRLLHSYIIKGKSQIECWFSRLKSFFRRRNDSFSGKCEWKEPPFPITILAIYWIFIKTVHAEMNMKYKWYYNKLYVYIYVQNRRYIYKRAFLMPLVPMLSLWYIFFGPSSCLSFHLRQRLVASLPRW
jgi:hypothetical protein